MAELILTDEEKQAPLYSDWSDETLGKATRQILCAFDAVAKQQYQGVAATAALHALAMAAEEVEAERLFFHYKLKEDGTVWRVMILGVGLSPMLPPGQKAIAGNETYRWHYYRDKNRIIWHQWIDWDDTGWVECQQCSHEATIDAAHAWLMAHEPEWLRKNAHHDPELAKRTIAMLMGETYTGAR